MFNVLLKKQMAEIFRSYLYDSKKNAKRSRLSMVLCFVFFALLMVGVLGGMVTALAIGICTPLVDAGFGWLYFAVMGLVAIFMGAFGSVFNTFSGLYLAKDNDLLLSMPIPIPVIMGSRLMGTYLMALMYSAVISIPAVVVYLAMGSFSVASLVCGILFVFLISVIDLELSCILGWVVAKISQKLKNKSFITVIVALVLIGLYYFIYFKAGTLVGDFIANASTYGAKVKDAVYPLYLFGRIGEGDWVSTFATLAVVGVVFAVMWMVLSRSFIKIVTTKSDSRVKGSKASFECRSVPSALFGKELSRFTSSANYMLNCGLGVLVTFAAAVVVLIKGHMIGLAVGQMFPNVQGAAAIVMCVGVCCVESMNIMVVPSISLEGKSLWIVQSIPVAPLQVLSAKLKVQVVLSVVPALLFLVAAQVAVPSGAAAMLLSAVYMVLFVNLYALFGLFLGLKMPNLNWTSEIIVIKQSMNVMVAMLAGIAYNAIVMVLFVLFGSVLGLAAFIGVAAAVTAILGALLWMWVRKKGCRIFAEL